MTYVLYTQKHDKMELIRSELSQKGLIYMSGSRTKETSSHAKTEEQAVSPVLKHLEIPARQRRLHSSAKSDESVIKSSIPESPLPNSAERIRTNNAMRLIRKSHQTILRASDMFDARKINLPRTNIAKRIILKSHQTILHASDMLAARNELGTLNLDYAEADKKMLEQAKKLQKRFG